MNKAFPLLVLLAAAVCSTTAGAAERAAAPLPVMETLLTRQVDGRIVVDPQGNLVEYTVESKLTETLRAKVEGMVAKWRFHPVLVEGRPVRAQTRMRITLSAKQEGENYLLNVDNVTFPGDQEGAVKADSEPLRATITGKSMTPPPYPSQMAAAGVEGVVLLYIRVDADGKVVDVMPVQAALLNVRGRDNLLAKAVAVFERNAVAKAKLWRFNVEVHDPNLRPSDMTVTVPVDYKMVGRKHNSEEWRVEVRGARKEASWLADESDMQRVGVSDVSEGRVAPLATAFKLATEVKGVAL